MMSAPPTGLQHPAAMSSAGPRRQPHSAEAAGEDGQAGEEGAAPAEPVGHPTGGQQAGAKAML
jgi:hypothetical protein